jgi:hypothetical protein
MYAGPGLVGVNPLSRCAVISTALMGTAYENLAGKRVSEPSEPASRPSREALAEHLAWACLEALDNA